VVDLLVHEWIEQHGGSENVFETMAAAFPDADIKCLWNDAPDRFRDRSVQESWLARTPLRSNKAAALPFMPSTWAKMNVRSYDSILVSSHLFAHHIGGRLPASGPTKHVYVHTPARYIWTPQLDPRGNSAHARLASRPLKAIDRKRASEGSVFAANSEFVRERIRDTWDQDALVIYPPVEVERLQAVSDWREHLSPEDQKVLESLPPGFLLGASRFVPYKRLDLVIQAGEDSGIPVVLAGAGPQLEQLTAAAAQARVPVHIVLRPSNSLLYALYQQAVAFIFPPVEDFGIMPVEAMCLGTPAIVGSLGGAKESVNALRGGIVIDLRSSAEMKSAIDKASTLDMAGAQTLADANFSSRSFRERIVSWLTPDDESGISHE